MTMNIQNDNRRKRTSVLHVMAALFMAATAFIFASCDDDINIQQSYPFTVETMPAESRRQVFGNAVHHPLLPVRGAGLAENG